MPVCAVLAIGLSVTTVAACSDQPASIAGPVGWEEPAWMAQARQQIEEHNTFVLSCLEQHGVDGLQIPGGDIMLGSTGDSPAMGPEHWEQVFALTEECWDQAPRPDIWHDTLAPITTAETYTQLLDVRTCLIAHGFEVEEPPPLEVWLEQTSSWSPYTYIMDNPPVDWAALSAAADVCLQVGSIIGWMP